MRVLSGFDPDRALRVIRWPLREALVAYGEHLRREARQQYDQARLEWALLAPWSKNLKPPKLPEILKDD